MSYPTSPEAREQFVATTYIDLTRHSSRFGGKMEITFPNGENMAFEDSKDLTPAGRTKAKDFAASAYPVEVTLVHPRGGDEARHGQTGEDLMKGSDRIGKSREQSSEGTPAPIFSSSGRVKVARRGKEIDYETAGAMADLKPALKMINTELSRLVQNLSPEDQEKFKTDSEFRAELREKAQIVGLKEAMKLEGLIKKLAENEAYELMHVLELSRRGVRAGEAKAIPMVGSGLFAESLF